MNLIPMKQALPKIGVGLTKAYALINEGRIVAVKIGARTLVDADSIDRFHASLPRVEPRNAAR